MAKGSIKLSKRHGLQPVIPLCFYCGKEKNQIVLLGAAGDKLAKSLGHEDGAMPMKAFLPGDLEPCDDCIKRGDICVAIAAMDMSLVGAGYAKEEDIKEVIADKELLSAILKKRVMVVDQQAADKLKIELRKGDK